MKKLRTTFLSSDDESVITWIKPCDGNLLKENAFVASHLIARIKRALSREENFYVQSKEGALLVSEGIPCKHLAFGASGWVSGKIRLALEFVPDEPEPLESESAEEASPLDDLRQTLADS